jgi:two-component system chemotaxis response regulator CheB
MRPIRILVVDDSAVVRKLLCEILSADPAIEVAGSAGDGRIGLARIAEWHPDLVTLDIEMPVMNGLETLKELRRRHPKLPVIMFSTLTGPGAEATLEALTLGASDCATKPSNTGSALRSADAIRAELIPKIKALCGRGTAWPKVQALIPSVAGPAVARGRSREPVEIIVIGSSTGGPNALAAVLPHIPKDFPVPILVVQHMPPMFSRLLADRLASQCSIPVVESGNGVRLTAGGVWIAPGDFHMTVARRGLFWELSLNQDPPENSCRPAVDVLFRSVAAAGRGGVLAVVLTGMGSDGALGARQIHDAGGEVLVQDESSSAVWGMPGAVYAAGLADGVYPLEQIASEIMRRVERGHAARPLIRSAPFASIEARAK